MNVIDVFWTQPRTFPLDWLDIINRSIALERNLNEAGIPTDKNT